MAHSKGIKAVEFGLLKIEIQPNPAKPELNIED
jgi:hypothetical protein